ncbi:cation:proton antiporter [Microbacterium sp. NIBRBAC000506063]|uniref:cation:proton antiporter n=1 Tax=Microbacterium sp. NIBRBAC000506063 TaxID=2734618 RepID=UPI001BB7D32D|nr:sodium:proton antiporter [Microbacterium sp. NIBRBAC000506063]QTV79123.1 sodium:proton antiporter [Microbacterium sp. NIBRBAC000506063]
MDGEIFLVLVCALAVAAFARWRGWPAPLLVTGVALAASLLPFAPTLDLDGHILLGIVLPPLLYSAALDVSFVNFKRSLPQIRRLGIGLVLVTTVVVGLLAWWIMPSLTLPGALLLGAIVAPPDAVSAAAIGRRLGLPRRIMTVLSGESLVNDATSLTLFRVLAAILAGATLTVWGGIWQFVLAVVLGAGIGLVFGIAMHQLRMRVDDSVLVGTFSLLVPFGAYAIAEHVGGSGVLSVVAMGLFVGYHSPKTSYATRQQERPLWLSADLLLESFVFAYIGLHSPALVAGLETDDVPTLLVLTGAVLLAVLLVRPAFVYPAYAWGQMWARLRQRRGAASGRSAPSGRPRYEPEPVLSWKDNAVVSWAGMRGVVTLATAIAAADLAGLDERSETVILFVAFSVTIATLLLQGLTLPLLIRALGVADGSDEAEEERAREAVRVASAKAGAEFLAAQRIEWEAKHGAAGTKVFDDIAERFSRVWADTDDLRETKKEASDAAAPSFADYVALSKGWLAMRREVLIRERDAGTLDEEVMRDLLTALDAEELALDTRSAVHPEEGGASRD